MDKQRRLFLKTVMATAAAPIAMLEARAQGNDQGKFNEIKVDERFDGLLDQNGEPFDFETLKGHHTLLFFGFVQCSTICTIALHNLSPALKNLEAHYSGKVDIKPVIVTSWPETDTPADFKYALEGGDPRYKNLDLSGFTGLSAQKLSHKYSRDEVIRAQAQKRMAQIKDIHERFKALAASHSAHHGGGRGPSQSHTPYAYLMDREGRFMGLVDTQRGPDVVFQNLETLLKKDHILDIDAPSISAP